MGEDKSKRIVKLPPEILKAKAYVAYINYGNIKESAEETGITTLVMKDWIEEGNWETERARHYDAVKRRVEEKLASLVEAKADMAVMLAEKIMDSISNDIELSELGSKKEAYEMIKIGVDALNKITGQQIDKGSSVDINISLDGKSRDVYNSAMNILEYDDETVGEVAESSGSSEE